MGALSTGVKEFLDLIYSFTHSYGLAIIVFTVVVRIVLYPLTLKQQKAMIDQRRVGPKVQEEMKKLQERYKKQPEELNRRTMELYRKYGYNPLSGCLPSLLQLPVIWVLFGVLRAHDFNKEGFLWVPLLTQPDPYYIWPILSALLTYVQTKMSSPATGASQTPGMGSMNVIMPIFIGLISLSFPAGLIMYWTVTTLVTIIQYYFINQRFATPAEEVDKT